jgi:hypothetical protein
VKEALSSIAFFVLGIIVLVGGLGMGFSAFKRSIDRIPDRCYLYTSVDGEKVVANRISSPKLSGDVLMVYDYYTAVPVILPAKGTKVKEVKCNV